MQRLDVFRHESVWVEGQRTVAGVPAVRAVAGSQINQRVARQFLFAEYAGDLQRLLRSGERAMRLKITERPFRRHHRPAGQPIVFRQGIGRALHADDEQVQRCAALRVLIRNESSSACTQIELAFGPVCEHRPALRADDKRRRDNGPEHGPVPAAPTRFHRIKCAAPIELLRAFAQAEHGSVRSKRHRGIGPCGTHRQRGLRALLGPRACAPCGWPLLEH